MPISLLRGLRKTKMGLLDNIFSTKKTESDKESGRRNSEPFQSSFLSSGNLNSERKNLRLERRELLYSVVRESMARVGILSSSYKYKVLSLDSHGRQYMIMMDLPVEMATEVLRLAEIETVVTQNAKNRHDIHVTAVYWRINDQSRGDETSKRKTPVPATMSVQEQDNPETNFQSTFMESHSPEEKNLEQSTQEVSPNLTSLDNNQSTKTGKSSQQFKSWQHSISSRTDFADTELLLPDDNVQTISNQLLKIKPKEMQNSESVEVPGKNTPLSSTQYGDLN